MNVSSFSHGRSVWRRIAIVVAGLCTITLCWWGWVAPDTVGENCRLDTNAAWISVDWTSQPVDPGLVSALAENAAKRKLQYLYPFTTYVKQDATFSPSYSHAAEFVAEFRRFNRETRLLAWIGVPIESKGGLGIEGWVDLSDVNARQRITTFAKALIETAGFDGVHLDVETVRNHDPHFVLLLAEIKNEIGPSRVLSIAGNDWKPDLLDKTPILGDYKWSGRYYQTVAAQVDQVAMMTYDSFAPHPALYRLWLREQVRGVTRGLTGSKVELLMGLSVSRERTLSHWPDAENMRSGLAGICAGLESRHTGRHPVSGVAIYAAWEATSGDWQTWDEWSTSSHQE